jgi:tetratricopeptide (TPR) repeat protein
VRYLFLTIWPHNLSPWYSHPSLEGPPLSLAHVAAAAALLVGITALLLHKSLRKSLLPVGWFWFLGTLVPMIGLIQVGRQGMADRYTYIPHIGLMIMVVWGIAMLPIWQNSRARVIGLALVAGIAAILGTQTWRQTAVWQNSVSLWEYTASKNPYSFIAHQALGLEYRRFRRNDEAIRELQRASAIRPEVSSVHVQLGDLFAANKDFDTALTHYNAAAELKPESARYQNKIGTTLLALGRWQEARAPIEKALAIDSNYAEAHVTLGRYWLAAGKIVKAANEFEAALYIAPNYKLASRYLELARQRLGLD